MARHYDNERIGQDLKKEFCYRRQRRKAQMYRFSTDETDIQFLKHFKHKRRRQAEISFTEDFDQGERP